MRYNDLVNKIKTIKNGEVKSIGSSVLGRTIFSITYNFYSKYYVLIHAGIHAREHITCGLVWHLIEIAENNKCNFINKLPNLVFVPMVNPDGVEFCQDGFNSIKNAKTAKIVKNIVKNTIIYEYKANINGIDLNNNFNAGFKSDPRYAKLPAPHGYPGEVFESEPETKALANLVQSLNCIFSISYHAKGEEIYYNYKLSNKQIKYHKQVASFFKKCLGYRLIDDCGQSAGGFKDYVIEKLKISSITVEVAKDSYTYPLPKEALSDIIKKHKNFYLYLQKAYKYIIKNLNRF